MLTEKQIQCLDWVGNEVEALVDTRTLTIKYSSDTPGECQRVKETKMTKAHPLYSVLEIVKRPKILI